VDYDPINDKIMAIAADRRRELLDDQMDALLRGALAMEQVEPYRPLSEAVKEKILATMRERFPRALDPVRELYGPGFRRLLERTRASAIARFERAAPKGERPGMVMSDSRPHPDDAYFFSADGITPKPKPVYFHPSTGEPLPSHWEDPPDPRFRPFPLDLPGPHWPDGGASDTFPVQAAMLDLGRVRWAPRRPTIFVADGAPEPE
jgi:hypothetical protein